ncbi:MAG: hypothetical protein ACREU5_06815 [Burkholderiales bacterium]
MRENERLELMHAAAALLESCAEAMARSPDNSELRLLRDASIDFAKAVLEHLQASHPPGAAADVLHAAARDFINNGELTGRIDAPNIAELRPWRLFLAAARHFRDEERVRMSRRATEPDL